jgi:DNA modification methylase
MRPIKALVPYARNARTHSDAQIAQIAASIAEFGFTNPVLADEHGIVAGHGRVLAARQLMDAGQPIKQIDGTALPKGKLPVIDCTGWSEGQRRAYIIADNRLAENAGWDRELLAIELADLEALGFDLGLTGFGEEELADLLASRTEGLTDPDAVPPVPEIPVAQPGDVWIAGRHRLACGDCRDPETVARLLGAVRPLLMVTDPPYGVDYDASWRAGAGLNREGAATGRVLNDELADWRAAWSLFPGDVAYVWHAGLHAPETYEGLASAGFEPRAQIIWAKSQLVIGRGNYHHQHEPLLYAVRKGKAARWAGGRKQTTLWEIDKPNKSETGHSTQKPVECMRRPIENNSSPGQAVYDPFVGSGTTIIAAEMTGRACYAIELNPAYVDVCLARWEAFTGEDATLEGDGRFFKMVAVERDQVAA